MLRENYRKDYTGEFVVVLTKWTNGKKEQIREWIPNPIENHHISGRAAIIGTGQSRERFNLRYLETHKGGLRAKKKLQTYGVNQVATDIKLDFLVVINKQDLEQLPSSQLENSTLIYTSSSNCIAFPGKFFMIPYNVKLVPEAVAAYIAAFDGHKEIFLVGCDAPETESARYKFVTDMAMVINTYKTVKFHIINNNLNNTPREWKMLRNVVEWDYRKFISECDIG